MDVFENHDTDVHIAREIGTLGGARAVIDSMLAIPDCALVQEHACGVLRNLASDGAGL